MSYPDARRLADDPKRKRVSGTEVELRAHMTALGHRGQLSRVRALANREAAKAARGLARRLDGLAHRDEKHAASMGAGENRLAAELIVRQRERRGSRD